MGFLNTLFGKKKPPSPADLEPCTEKQGNYIVMMISNLDGWSTGNPDNRYADAYYAMKARLAPYIDTDDYYDRSKWTLSKSKATEIITATEPDYRRIEQLG